MNRRLALAFALVLLPALARADAWAPNLTLTAAWNDNASNADRSDDKVGAFSFSGDLLASERYSLGRADAAHVSFHAAGAWWPRFMGLSSVAGGGRIDWEHKFGLGALAPVFSAELAGDFVGANESERRGMSAGATLAWRKRFNDRWRARLSESFDEMYARAAVFDRSGAQTMLEVERDLNEMSRVTFGVFYRDGDVVSYATPPRPDIVALAPNRMPVTTFDRSFVAYAVRASTWGGRVAYVHALNREAAVVAAYEVRRTEQSSLRYVNQLVSLALVRQF